jgi:hypothetical protein
VKRLLLCLFLLVLFLRLGDVLFFEFPINFFLLIKLTLTSLKLLGRKRVVLSLLGHLLQLSDYMRLVNLQH